MEGLAEPNAWCPRHCASPEFRWVTIDGRYVPDNIAKKVCVLFVHREGMLADLRRWR
jgi:hypothetical protein